MVKDAELYESQKMNEISTSPKVEVTNLSVKQFHRMLKKKPPSSLQVFIVLQKVYLGIRGLKK